MKLIITAFALLCFLPAMVSALPAGQQNLDLCVRSLMAQTTNTYAVAQACAGVQNPKLIIDCVAELRTKLGFAMPDAATACAGVSDQQKLASCLSVEKKAGFVDDEVVILCSQK